MDRLKGIEYFKRIVELGSFTAVAEEFDCSNAVISKYVKYLESWTGCRLVNRNTRTISITEEGKRFYTYCVGVLSDTSDVMDHLQQEEEALGQLVIASPVSLSVKLLAPLIREFQRLHPSLQVRLNMSDQITDLVSAGVDLAIRGIETPDDSSLIAVRLGTLHRCIVASPSYLQEYGRPAHFSELPRHNCLIYSLSSDSSDWYLLDEKSGDGTHVPVTGTLTADSSMLLIEAAKTGQGIALVPLSYVTEELAEGSLIRLQLGAKPAPRSIYAVYSDRQYLPKRARLFVDFLKGALAD